MDTILQLTIDEQNIILQDGRSYIEAGYLGSLKPFHTVPAVRALKKSVRITGIFYMLDFQEKKGRTRDAYE